MTTMKNQQQAHTGRFANGLFYTILMGLTLTAVVLRLYQLGHWSFWSDELSTLYHATNIVGRISPGTFIYGFLYGQSLSNILIGSAVLILGFGEWAARFTPMLTGVLTVPIAGVALRHWVGDRVALLTSLFITVSAWHVYWSQNARYLVMQLLIYTLLFILIYTSWQQRRFYYLLLIGPLLILLYLERLTGLGFIIVAITLYFVAWSIWKHGDRWRKLLTSRNITLFTIPIVLFLGIFAWRVLQDPATWVLLMEGRNNTIFSLLGSFALSIRPIIFSLGIIGMVYVWLKYDRDHILVLFSFAATIPLLLIMFASFFLFTTDRYLFPAFIFWLVFVSLILVNLLDSKQHLVRASAILLIGIILADSANQLWHYHVHQEQVFRPDWKGAYAYVESRMSADDYIVTTSWRRPLAEYYLGDDAAIIEERDLTADNLLVTSDNLWVPHDTVVWFVLLEVRIGPDLNAWLETYQPQMVYETVDIKVYRYGPVSTSLRH